MAGKEATAPGGSAAGIKFGTSGWRAIIADEFTFANVRRVVAAIADHVRERKEAETSIVSANKKPTLIIGHDTRFFSEEFSRAAADVLRSRGLRVLLCDAAAPTPAIAYEILRRKTDGAINFTASHNPAEYHGLKFSGADGGPALPAATKDIEARVARMSGVPQPPHREDGAGIESFSPRDPYLKRLTELVDFGRIRAAKLNMVCDPLHGAGAGYLDRILADQGITPQTIRAERDVLFDGTGPDVSEENLAPLAQAMKDCGAQVGLATDGDADRFGILDEGGAFVQPNHILALLYDYLVETRGWKLGAARSVATTHLLDAVARHYGVEIYSTPVGFKYVGELIKKDKIALGGEESAGMSIRGHVPEKDGILACLLVAEMIAARRATIAEQLRALFARIGTECWPLRVNLHLDAEVKARVVERLKKDRREFLGRKVETLDRTDGAKFVFAGGEWALMRLSGTEPLLRLYTEAASLKASQRLAEEAKRWILEN